MNEPPAHRSHLENDKAIIRLSTGYCRHASRLHREQKEGGTEDPHGAKGLYQSSLLPLFPPSSLSLPSSCLISSDDEIRPSHVTLNCSIISQSLSQPITFAVVPETSIYWLGTYARHYVLASSQIEFVHFPIDCFLRNEFGLRNIIIRYDSCFVQILSIFFLFINSQLLVKNAEESNFMFMQVFPTFRSIFSPPIAMLFLVFIKHNIISFEIISRIP